MPKPSEQDRQSRILDAAENAVAELGFAGASLRHIVLEAQVNLATVYYYFGSKRGLMEAVLKRRFGPLRQEHLALLRQFEQAAKGRPLPVEKILEAMLLPPLRLAAKAPAKRQAVTRLIGRIVTEPNPQIQHALSSQRLEVRTAFLKALRHSLPKAPLPALQWRVEFVWGALAFVLCNPRKIEIETRGACDLEDTNSVLAEMIQFFSPGFKALARGTRKP
jgi:AcrR family transcriptional regulator